MLSKNLCNEGASHAWHAVVLVEAAAVLVAVVMVVGCGGDGCVLSRAVLVLLTLQTVCRRWRLLGAYLALAVSVALAL